MQLGEVELLERGIEGQGREREVDVDEDQEDARVVVDEEASRAP
jgi:hypothetical protein